MYKDGQLTISNWYQGMTKHPIMGFSLIQNAEVFENKGLANPKRGLVTAAKTTNALPIAEVTDIYGNTYHATSVTGSGNVYKNGTSQIITGLGSIYDAKIYKNYLFVRYETGGASNLGAYGPLDSASAAWFPTVLTGFSAGYWGQMVVGQDDFLYSTNGNLVSKISVVAAAVGVAPTATLVGSLDLKDGEYATCIAEYGTKLQIGTTSGKVYPWNRQLGTLGNPGLADLPVDFNENGVYQLYTHANKLYVTAGRNGNVYISDGTNYRKLAQIPFTGERPFVSYYPNAITISEKGTLLIGNVSTNGISECGVWEILDTGEVCLAYTLATGKTSTGNIGIGFLRVNRSDDALSVGWYNQTSNGIDVDTNNYATFIIESPLVRVGTYNKKKTFEHIEFALAQLLETGNTITISWRKSTSEEYVPIKTWDFANLGAVPSFEDIAALSDCEFIQIKIEAYGVYLVNVTLR